MTYVKQCLAEIQRMVDEEGLQGISGTNFNRGHPIRRVLKAKQFEYKMYEGKHASVALIAKELYLMLTAEGKPLIFEDSSSKEVYVVPYRDY